MFYGAKAGKVKVDKTDMDYVSFGKGQKALIIIPGLGDGLRTVKGTQILLARMCKLFAKQNNIMINVIKNWITLAEHNDYRSLIIDTMEKTYTENKLKKYRVLYPVITRIGKPKTFSRLIVQANACLHHNAYDELDKITCPTLVIGGDNDQVVGNNASEEMAARIHKSKLVLYQGLGHGAYEEAKDFNQQVLNFLNS